MAKDTKKEQSKTVAELKAENNALHQQLTNKNRDYMFQLNSRLDKLDYDETKKIYVFNTMYQEIIAAQESSLTARRVYGTVSEQVDNILGNKVAVGEDNTERSPDKLIYLDGALLMGGLFNILYGFSAFRAEEAGMQIGLVQVLLNFFLGGLAVMLLTRFVPKAGETKGLLKYALATLVIVVGWVMLTTAIIIILEPIDVGLPGLLVMVIGGLSLLAKWYFKKKLGIRGTII